MPVTGICSLWSRVDVKCSDMEVVNSCLVLLWYCGRSVGGDASRCEAFNIMVFVSFHCCVVADADEKSLNGKYLPFYVSTLSWLLYLIRHWDSLQMTVESVVVKFLRWPGRLSTIHKCICIFVCVLDMVFFTTHEHSNMMELIAGISAIYWEYKISVMEAVGRQRQSVGRTSYTTVTLHHLEKLNIILRMYILMSWYHWLDT